PSAWRGHLGRGGQVARVHPEGLIAEIRRNVHYPTADWRAVLTEEPLDPQDISRGSGRPLTRLKPLWCGYRLTKWGCYLYRKGRWCNPPPDHLEAYATHAGHRRGHWST